MYPDMPVQEELKLIYSLVKPKYAVPVHGECKSRKQIQRSRAESWNPE